MPVPSGLDAVPWVAGILAALGTIGLSATWAGKKVFRVYRLLQALIRKAKTFDSLESEDLKELLANSRAVLAEFRPNGGMSMRDQVDTLMLNVRELLTMHEMGVARLHYFFGGVPCAAFGESDPEGHVLYVSDGFEKLAGMAAVDALDQGWTLALDEPHKTKVIEEWGRCIKYERPFKMNYPYAKTGVYVTARADPYRDREGAISSWFWTIVPAQPPCREET